MQVGQATVNDDCFAALLAPAAPTSPREKKLRGVRKQTSAVRCQNLDRSPMFWLWLEPATHWIVPYSSAAKVTKAALSALGELAAHGDPEVHEVLVSRLRDRPMLCMERGNIVSGLGAAKTQISGALGSLLETGAWPELCTLSISTGGHHTGCLFDEEFQRESSGFTHGWLGKRG